LIFAERLLSEVNSHKFGDKKKKIKLKISIGVASYPENNVVKGMELVRIADKILKKAKEAAKKTKLKKIIVVNRINKMPKGKIFLDFDKELEKADSSCEPEIMNSEDTLFILYTSGTTGKPKGVIHDTGGYAIQAYQTCKWNFDLHPEDIMWCTADIGWITGHTYAMYGPLLTGATTLIYEGGPDFPNPGRWWKIIQDHKVNVFYTAPTAVRMFMKIKQHRVVVWILIPA